MITIDGVLTLIDQRIAEFGEKEIEAERQSKKSRLKKFDRDVLESRHVMYSCVKVAMMHLKRDILSQVTN